MADIPIAIARATCPGKVLNKGVMYDGFNKLTSNVIKIGASARTNPEIFA